MPSGALARKRKAAKAISRTAAWAFRRPSHHGALGRQPSAKKMPPVVADADDAPVKRVELAPTRTNSEMVVTVVTRLDSLVFLIVTSQFRPLFGYDRFSWKFTQVTTVTTFLRF